jgi:hypothetical protein
MGAGAAALARKPVLLLETLFHWLMEDKALLRQCAGNAQKLGQPQAAYAVADLAWQLAGRGPYRRRHFRASQANDKSPDFKTR